MTWLWRWLTGYHLSPGYLRDLERRSWAQGIEQSSINWDVMKKTRGGDDHEQLRMPVTTAKVPMGAVQRQ